MADGLLDMIIQSADFDKLNVQPGDVLKGKLYVGADRQTHVGEIEDRGSPTLYLDLNGKLTLPAGKYGGGAVKQSIPTMGETHATPGSKQITLYTDGVYMTGNIIVDRLNNLVPENIKLNEYVGGVGPGTWQGYLVSDPNVFYYRGTFGPGQSMDDYISNDVQSNYMAKRTNTLKSLEYIISDHGYSDGGNSVYSVFNKPIDLTTVNKLTIEYSVRMPGNSPHVFGVYLTPDKNLRYLAAKGLSIVYTEVSLSGKDTTENRRTVEIDVSSFSRSAYLSVNITVPFSGFKHNIHSVKFQ